jgi:hypothetical protein
VSSFGEEYAMCLGGLVHCTMALHSMYGEKAGIVLSKDPVFACSDNIVLGASE